MNKDFGASGTPVRVAMFAARPDELPHCAVAQELGVELVMVDEPLSASSAARAAGCAAVSVAGANTVDAAAVRALTEAGVHYLALRSIGFNNVDAQAAQECGLQVSNAPYSPASVAEFSVMLAMMGLRRMRSIMQRSAAQDLSLAGHLGREIGECTVGVLGTGRIGACAARLFHGLGAKVLGYDVYHNDSLEGVLSYATLDEVLAASDVISVHIPLMPATEHLIDAAAIAKMKDGAGIVNCARGELVDTRALIAGLKSGKIGFAGLDTVEGEHDYFHHDWKGRVMPNDDISLLRSYPNVIMTQHCSFYTDEAVRDMVANSLKSCVAFAETGTSPFEVKLG